MPTLIHAIHMGFRKLMSLRPGRPPNHHRSSLHPLEIVVFAVFARLDQIYFGLIDRLDALPATITRTSPHTVQRNG